MPYAILRFQKRKAGGVAACERHNERKKEAYKSNPDIDMERSKNNYHLIAPPKYTYNSITISSTSVNTTATTGTFTSNAGKVETTSSCVFWLTGKSGYQEFISERPTADPIKAYIKVKTENIGYGELTKTDESSGVKLSGAVYGIYSDSGCTNRVQTMTTDGNGYAKSAALVAGTYYVKEITAPKGYVLSGKVHTLTVKAGQTTGISATDKEQLGAITIYKEGEVLSSWNGSNFTYEKKKLPGATFKVTAGADIYKADGTKVYNAGSILMSSMSCLIRSILQNICSSSGRR